jgi:hypothetical protein
LYFFLCWLRAFQGVGMRITVCGPRVFTVALQHPPAATEQVEYHYYEHNDQQHVNEAATNVTQ